MQISPEYSPITFLLELNPANKIGHDELPLRRVRLVLFERLEVCEDEREATSPAQSSAAGELLEAWIGVDVEVGRATLGLLTTHHVHADDVAKPSRQPQSQQINHLLAQQLRNKHLLTVYTRKPS